MAGPRLDLVHKAISSGTLGHIQWKDSAVRRLLDDPQMQGFTPMGVRQLLQGFVLAGNSLDTREEKRAEQLEECPDDPYWYRAIIPVADFPKGLFVELKLIDDDENEPWVEIVSAHQQL